MNTKDKVLHQTSIATHIDLAIESLEWISIHHKWWRSAEYPRMWMEKARAHVQMAIDAIETEQRMARS